MSTDLSGIGLRLREIRKINDITQPVMAAAIDVSDRAYKNYEQEKRELPALTALNISEAFRVDLEWLLAGRRRLPKSLTTCTFLGMCSVFCFDFLDVK